MTVEVELDFYTVIVPDDINGIHNKHNNNIDNYYVIALHGEYKIFDDILNNKVEYDSIGKILNTFDESKLFDEIEDQDIGNIRFHSLIKNFSNYEEDLYKGIWKNAESSLKNNNSLMKLVEKAHTDEITVKKVHWQIKQ